MPLYDYQCASCGHVHEVLKSRTADDPTVCTACNTPGLKRLLSTTQFHLKGGGWYKDGYDRNPGSKDNPSSTSSKASEPQTSASTNTTSSSGDAS